MKINAFGAALTMLLVPAAVSPVLAAPRWRNAPMFPAPRLNHSKTISWQANIDKTVNVYVRGDRVWSTVVSGNRVMDEVILVSRPLPSRPVHVRVARVYGRGSVYVFQQPNRRNGFTAGFRVGDPLPGRSNYRVRVFWSLRPHPNL